MPTVMYAADVKYRNFVLAAEAADVFTIKLLPVLA
jgi:hypothetical protein